jgi:hypothetical protein
MLKKVYKKSVFFVILYFTANLGLKEIKKNKYLINGILDESHHSIKQ